MNHLITYPDTVAAHLGTFTLCAFLLAAPIVILLLNDIVMTMWRTRLIRREIARLEAGRV